MIPKKYFFAYLALSFMLYFVLFIWGLLQKGEADRHLLIAQNNQKEAQKHKDIAIDIKLHSLKVKEMSRRLRYSSDSCQALEQEQRHEVVRHMLIAQNMHKLAQKQFEIAKETKLDLLKAKEMNHRLSFSLDSCQALIQKP
jgi:negative regulator of replication initiation